MGQRRDRLNKRREKQLKTRRANAHRKARERARKAAFREKNQVQTNRTEKQPPTIDAS